MPGEIEVNQSYCYDDEDLSQLMLKYQAQEENPNNIWGVPIGSRGD